MSSSSGKEKRKLLTDELTTTDKLLVLLLLKLGATQNEIGQALGVKQPTVSKTFRWRVRPLVADGMPKTGSKA